MHQADQHEPKGPTTGPLRPVIVVMDTIDDDGEQEGAPLPEQGRDHQNDHDDDQDRLPPVPDTHPEEQDPEGESMPPLPPRAPQPLPLPASRPRRSRPRVPRMAGGIGLLLLGMLTGMFLTQHGAFAGWALANLPGGLAPTASVTLTPASARLSLTVPITAVTGTPDASKHLVSARLLATKSTTFTQTVKTSGHGHSDAHAAQGTLTFYNAAPYAQTIAAGTVLTSGENVQIVTDEAAVLPAGNPPAFGVATVAAHAVAVGPQGNLAPLSLNGLCCVAGISVKNTGAFTAGQNARDYAVVMQQDVDPIAGAQRALLSQQAQASLQGQVRPGEQLASPAQCHPSVTTDHPVGSEASQVTISVVATCRGEVYDQQGVQQLATGVLTQQAHTTLGVGYALQGSISTTVTQIATTEQAHGTLSLLVKAQGTWSYQFSSTEIARLSGRIAGQSQQAALHLLRHDAHIQAVSITETWNASRLPTDPTHIQVMVLSNVGG